jgi:hypothetical protein
VSGEGRGITTVMGYRELHFSHTYTALLLLTGVLKYIIPENSKGIYIALEVSLLHLLHLKLMLHNSQINKKKPVLSSHSMHLYL